MGSLGVTPREEEHIKLQNEVGEYLQSLGFWIDSATYHDRLAKERADHLSGIYSLTALYIRGRADRIAVHSTRNVVFEWEIKTHKSPDKTDMSFEALPFMHHVQQGQLGVKCLYIYRNPFPNQILDIGFWIHDMPPIEAILIPDNPYYSSETHALIEETAQKLLFRTNRTRPTKGSNDPFALVEEKYVRCLPHWKNLILEALQQ